MAQNKEKKSILDLANPAQNFEKYISPKPTSHTLYTALNCIFDQKIEVRYSDGIGLTALESVVLKITLHQTVNSIVKVSDG